MGVQVRQSESGVVVRFEDRELSDDDQIQRVSDELRGVLQAAPTGARLLLDFQDVDTMASMMLSDLVTLNTEAAEKGVMLQLGGLSPHVERVIKTCHLDRLFNLSDDPPNGAP